MTSPEQRAIVLDRARINLNYLVYAFVRAGCTVPIATIVRLQFVALQAERIGQELR